MKPRSLWLILGLSGLVTLAGCTQYSVRTTDFTQAESAAVAVPEDHLLDIGIQTFEPDIESRPEEALNFSDIRRAESVWVAEQLKRTLQETEAWGVVRVIPDDRVIMDLKLSGRILQSDGETLKLAVVAEDASGKVWIDKTYEQVVSEYAYAPEQSDQEAFQGIYNQISNDLLDQLQGMESRDRLALRKITSIKFARSFSPEAFGDYLVEDDEGQWQIDRLPAQNDPMLQRVERIRTRDELFVDVLQDYYRNFTARMDEPYQVWREQSYRQTTIIRELEKSARARKIGGWMALIGGVAAQFEENDMARLMGQVAIYGGVEHIRSGYQRQDEAALHIQTLSELGQSLESELEPSIIELQDRTVTLAGTVRDQYEEWRDILRNIYYEETGYKRPSSD